MTKLRQLEHVTLYAHDVRRLAAFYETALGLAGSQTPGDDGPARLAIDPSSGRAELVILNNPRHMRLAFSTETLSDFKAIWHRMKALGIFTQGPYWQQEGPTFSMFDPEGNHVQIIWIVRTACQPGSQVTFGELAELADQTGQT
ncbi:VOC family protein [Paenibacillus gansuensis]|uniref:VOC family protein n=1 Tax=Paenibacillus gansuensis TaxID=306542 RepID=A0ABW5P8K1_9BACL